MKCCVCETRQAEPDQKVCIECEGLEDYLNSAPATNGYVSPMPPSMPSFRETATMKAVEEAPPKPKTMTAYCAKDGCDEPVYSRGKCRKHYQNELYHKKRSREGKTVTPKGPKLESYVAQGDTCNDPPQYKKVATPRKKSADADLDGLRARALQERDDAIAAAQAKYNKLVDAIDLVESLRKELG